MPLLHTCPHGHRWEDPDEALSRPEDGLSCPVCGAPESAGSAETVESDPRSEATLPVPRRAAPAPPLDVSEQTLAAPGKSEAPASDVLAQTLAPPGAGLRRAPADSDSTLALSVQPDEAPPAAPIEATLLGRSVAASKKGPAGDGTELLTPGEGRPPVDDPSEGTERIDPAEDGTRRRRTAGVGPAAASASVEGPTRAAESAPRISTGPASPTIPGYKVVGELGRGGMGVVYKATQIGLNRLVAVKMILSGDYAGQDELARFRLEAEAVAKLQHPYIVQVYEIDEVDGRPYFCLEFVDGAPLDKMLAGNPQPARQAAALVEKLAQAMAYAHERHIIHRDLKPPNILMTSAGDPKITDFGLAKRLDSQDMQTQSGSVMGTPSYMAPEQAHGRLKEVGPASDIYSLGAILYEALVGRPPFKGETVMDTLDQVRTLEPAPPSRLRPKLPHDLETICLKCLQKEPAKRYAGSAALAEDLRRWLAGEPIKARPTPSWERAWKWARRRPAWAALAAVASLLVLVLIGGGFAFGAYQQGQAEKEKKFNKEITEKNKQITEDYDALAAQTRSTRGNFHLAEDTMRTILARVFAERLRYEPKMEQLRRQVLDDALDFNEVLLAANPVDPEGRRETGRAHALEGYIYFMLGDPKIAEQHYDSARTIFTALRDDFPNDPQYQGDLAKCLNDLAALLQDGYRIPEAESAYREALVLMQQLADSSDRDEDRKDLAAIAGNLGNLLNSEGRLTEAEPLLKQSLDLRQRLAAASANPENVLDLAHGREGLGVLLGAAGRLDEADPVCRDAIVPLKKMTTDNADLPDYRYELAQSYKVLADLWRDAKPKAAEEQYQNALVLSQQLVEQFPTVPSYQRQLAETYRNLALLCQAAGRPEEAQQDYDKVLVIEKHVADSYPTVAEFRLDQAKTLNNTGIRLQTANHLKEAEGRYNEALTMLEKLSADHPNVPAYDQERANLLQNLGVLYTVTMRGDEGGKLLERAADLRRRLVEAHPNAPYFQKDLARADSDLGGFWKIAGNAPKAEACYREAIGWLDKLAGQYPQVPDYRHMRAYALKDYGVLLRAINRGDDAEKLWAKAVELLTALTQEQPTVPAYRQELARTLSEWGVYQASSGRDAEAEKHLTRTLEIQEKLAADFPKNPAYRQELAIYHDNLGFLYQRGGRFNLAEQSYRRAVDLAEELEKADPDNPIYGSGLVTPYANLVNLLTAQNPLSGDLPQLWVRRVGNLRKLAAAYAKAPLVQSQAALALEDMAAWLRERRRLPESRDALKEAVAFQRTAVDLALPQVKDGYRSLLCDECLSLAETLMALNDRTGASDAVAELTKAKPGGWPGDPKAGDRLKAVQDELKKIVPSP